MTGRPVVRGSEDDAVDDATVEWGEERQLAAEALAELLTDPGGATKARAVVIVGLRVVGRLNLEVAELRLPLLAHRCRFDEPINLARAVAPEIQLTSCVIPGITADQIETRDGFDLRNGIVPVVSLSGARIGGDLLLSGATLAGGAWPIDHADGRISPSPPLAAGQLVTALRAQELHVGRDLRADAGFRAGASVRLADARVLGEVSFDGASLARGLDVTGIRVDGAMRCAGLAADDEVDLLNARISGPLGFHGATLRGGLMGDGLRAEADVFFRDGFEAHERIRMIGACVGGQLDFDGAKLDGGFGADHLEVGDSMFCRDGFRAGGEVRLLAAHIKGQLSFKGATLLGEGLALDLESARIDQALSLLFAASPAGGIDLTRATVGTLWDSERTWPPMLRLSGCTYDELLAYEDRYDAEEPRRPGVGRRLRAELGALPSPDVLRRLRWLRLGEVEYGYAVQPYTQLMSVHRRDGRDGDARHVGYERERRRSARLGVAGKAWNGFLRWTVGYGYRPLRALIALGIAVVVGALVFSSFHHRGDLRALHQAHPQFVASIYTLDRMIPVVSFGLRDAFSPRDTAQWLAFAYTLIGWALTIAVLAGLNAAARRD